MIIKNAIVSRLLLSGLAMLLLASLLFIHCDKDPTAPEETSPIVGSWLRGYNAVNTDYESLTFYPNGYVMYWISPDWNEEEDTCGGVEIGIYTYDPENQYITINVLLDCNGNNGLADNGESYFDGSGDGEMFLRNDTLIIHDDDSNLNSYRIKNNYDTNRLVGSWGICRYNDSIPEYSNMTFTPYDCKLWLVNDPENPESSTGVEIYWYSINQQNSVISFHNRFFDENDSNGFAGNGPYGGTWNFDFAINHDTLAFYIDGQEIWSGPKVR